jgi:ActR/RegA family two-component response regulator
MVASAKSRRMSQTRPESEIMPHEHHIGIVGRVADGIGWTLTAIGALFAATPSVVSANQQAVTATGYGGVIISVIGLLTLIARLVYTDRHEVRMDLARRDDSLAKLAQAMAEASESKRMLAEARTEYDKVRTQNAELQSAMSKIDANSKRIAEYEEAYRQLIGLGVIRPGVEDDSDVRNTEHILIVDDDIDTSAVMFRLFKGKGYCAHVAGTVAEAKLKIRRYDPKWTILDVVLPDGSGLDVLRYARDEKMRCKFMVISGAVTIDGLESSGKYAPEAVLTKPFQVVDMWSIMDETAERQVIEPTQS